MKTVLQPNVFGHPTKILTKLYEELQAMGLAHRKIEHLSPSKALLARYGSIETIEIAIGEGVFQGVKESIGEFSQWRKIWREVINKKRRLAPVKFAALEALGSHIKTCKKAGASDSEILSRVMKLLNSGV